LAKVYDEVAKANPAADATTAEPTQAPHEGGENPDIKDAEVK
jgi:hypothetical protein